MFRRKFSISRFEMSIFTVCLVFENTVSMPGILHVRFSVVPISLDKEVGANFSL